MSDQQDSLSEWFSSCFVSNEDFTVNQGEELYSEGATCFTYKVRMDGRLYLLKKLKPEFENDPRFIVALQKEFYVGSTLSHPNLVQYSKAGHSGLLMEFVNGLTLTKLLEEDKTFFLDKGRAEKFLTQLLDAVGYMHQQHVLHLDLKPDNVMITQLGKDVKVIDLGFCYTDSYDNTRGFTKAFAAPEQIGGGNLTEQTDQYAIGRILEWINAKSGRRVFPSHIVRKCTAEQPQRRYAATADVLSAYRNAAKRRKRQMAVGLAIATGLLVATACTWLTFGQGPAPKIQEGLAASISPDSARNGVYIMDWDGRLVPTEKWDTNYQALAVAVIEDEYRARIALQDCNKEVVWGPEGLNLNVVASTAEANDNGGEGLLDYNGEYNTYQFNSRQSVADTTALFISQNYNFQDGSQGYLPALGELYSIYQNRLEEINDALALCGGQPLTGWYWSSTQKMNPGRAWAFDYSHGLCFAQLRSGQSAGADLYGIFCCKVRPFGSIKKRTKENYPAAWILNSKQNALQQEKLEEMMKKKETAK